MYLALRRNLCDILLQNTFLLVIMHTLSLPEIFFFHPESPCILKWISNASFFLKVIGFVRKSEKCICKSDLLKVNRTQLSAIFNNNKRFYKFTSYKIKHNFHTVE